MININLLFKRNNNKKKINLTSKIINIGMNLLKKYKRVILLSNFQILIVVIYIRL